MPLDGTVIASMVHELDQTIKNGKIEKIYQPEKDQIFLQIRRYQSTHQLLLSVASTTPFISIPRLVIANPLQAPMFSMVLRKHLLHATITAVKQIEFDRIIDIEFSAYDELKDKCTKHLIMEFMGKHSNIILCNEQRTIIDAIKHISFHVSSVREVLPNRPYFLVNNQKQNPMNITKEQFFSLFSEHDLEPKKLQNLFQGISAQMAEEIVYRGNNDQKSHSLSPLDALWLGFLSFQNELLEKRFSYQLYRNENKIIDFSSLAMQSYHLYSTTSFDSVFEMVDLVYSEKVEQHTLKQKTADLRKLIQSFLQKNIKKQAKLAEEYEDCEQMEQDKLYGMLLTANIYRKGPFENPFSCINFYSDALETVSIAVDENKSLQENAALYFTRYQKLKRKKEAMTTQIEQTKLEIDYLNSVLQAVDLAENEDDILRIREELMQANYIRYRKLQKQTTSKEKKFLRFQSSEGLDIWVGKNNLQNEELSFTVASKNDYWFHVKQQAGSHVILRTNQKNFTEISLQEAAAYALLYSKSAPSQSHDVDYCLAKYVKKHPSKKPGMVLYTNYKTIKAYIDLIKKNR